MKKKIGVNGLFQLGGAMEKCCRKFDFPLKKVLPVMLMLMSSHAIAANAPPIVLESIAQVEISVKNEMGEMEIKKVDANKANVTPGDIVIFTTYYANNGKKAADDITINNPMPPDMLYIEGTAEGSGARIEFSANDGKSFHKPDKLKIKDEEGRERLAGPSDYTHIRWRFIKALKPGRSGSVSFRARVK